MKLLSTLFVSSMLLLGVCVVASAQENEDMKPEDTEWYEPVPPVVEPGDNFFLPPPSDAIILFDGSDMNQWKSSEDGGEVPWVMEDGYCYCAPRDRRYRNKGEIWQLSALYRMEVANQY